VNKINEMGNQAKGIAKKKISFGKTHAKEI